MSGEFVHPAAPPLTLDMAKVRNFFFLTAVLLMNYTLMRPSPVDATFLIAFSLSLTINQKLAPNFLLHLLIVTVWIASLYVSSVQFIDNPLVQFQFIALSFVVVLSIAACYISSTWRERNFNRFFSVYIVACCIAATLGVIGFALQIELLTWDGRAKGLLDDPNMFGGLLLPGILACVYRLRHGARPFLTGGALALLSLALFLSFSRIAIVSFLVFVALLVVFLYRRNPMRAGVYFLALFGVIVLVACVSFLSIDNFAEKLADRFTFAKDYDLGYGGRYSRWLRSFSFILDYPLGMGLFEVDKYFPEPVHNFVLSSFMNYGWAAGIACLFLLAMAVRITISNFRLTGSELPVLLFFCFASIMLCALFHQAERWRSLWLFIGLVYGFNARNFAGTVNCASRTSDRAAGLAAPAAA